MIASVRGTLASREIDVVQVSTASGVGYEVLIPLSVFEILPAIGEEVFLHTHLVVKEDGWQLYGFASMHEREVFRRVLQAKGVGPGLALGMLSTLTAERVVRAIIDRDVATLQSVPRVGRKKAEQLILDLADKMEALQAESVDEPGTGARTEAGSEDAVRALVSLGFSAAESERAVRAALEKGAADTSPAELIRLALAHAGGGK